MINKKITSMFVAGNLTSLKYLPQWVILLIDIAVCIISFLIVYLFSIRINYTTHCPHLGIGTMISIVMCCQVLFFWFFHTYASVLRYSNYADATKILLSVGCNVLLLTVLNLFVSNVWGLYIFPCSILWVYGICAFLFLFLLRLMVNMAYNTLHSNSNVTVPIMIYGTQSSGIGLAKMLRSTATSLYKVIGFIDDDIRAERKYIIGIKVYLANEKSIQNIIAKKTKTVIVSPMKMQSINHEKLNLFLNNGISILTAPSIEVSQLKQIKSIQIEDLLDRPEIEISTEKISQQLHAKKILITGAAGSIGSEIVQQIAHYQPSMIVLLDQAETPLHELRLELNSKYPQLNFNVFLGDVRNKERMRYMMEMYSPDVVYHAAAYKHVPLMEENSIESVLANVLGTKNMADLAVEFGVKRFVMISTDKAVNPTNVMGASKRIAEIYVQSLFKKLHKIDPNCTKFITTRFGNVLGSNGSVIPHFKKQISEGGPVTVTHPDIIRYFMTIPEACMLVMEASTLADGGEIFIFDMGQPIKIVDLARKMIRLSGFVPDVDIKIEYTGLRPGEKLFEELLHNKEKTIETTNKKILVAQVQEYDFDTISIDIIKLINFAELCKDFLVVSTMKQIIPEYKSKNSQYEKLDL